MRGPTDLRAPVIRRDLSAAEVRVLGCLIEKQRTTPDGYPLTRNSLRLACNQSTNRDPVVDYDEGAVRAALERLGRNGFVRFTSTQGSRSAKYRHLAGDKLGIGDAELALLCLLMLRGPQTPGELRGRGERLHHFGQAAEVEQVLLRLIDAGLAVRFDRRPGQKEPRFTHLLSSESDEDDEQLLVEREEDPVLDPPRDRPAASAPPLGPRPSAGLEERVSALEAELRALREQLADILDD